MFPHTRSAINEFEGKANDGLRAKLFEILNDFLCGDYDYAQALVRFRLVKTTVGLTITGEAKADAVCRAFEKEASQKTQTAAAAMGAAKSEAKTAAARENGAKGGRPAKYRTERELINGGEDAIWTIYEYENGAYVHAGKVQMAADATRDDAIRALGEITG